MAVHEILRPVILVRSITLYLEIHIPLPLQVICFFNDKHLWEEQLNLFIN